MVNDNKDKINRVLSIYSKLMNGYVVNKAEEAQNFGVNERSIQRDLEDIREYMDAESTETGMLNTVVYDRRQNGYRLEKIYDMKLSNSEILAICKILLDSRSLTKKEMNSVLKKVVDCCVPEANRKVVQELIHNEQFHYIEPRHQSVFIDKMWEIGTAIKEHRYIEIKYQGVQGSTLKTRKLKPLAIMFSEYYFYLTAFIDDNVVKENFSVLDDSFPTIYRIDRIQNLKVLGEKYQIPYKDRFEEGEFRKRIQFMYGGRLRRIRFTYSGYSVEAVLDRLPTATIESADKIDDKRNVYTISAEVFGDGIDMWLKSQGDTVKIIEMK